MLPVRQEKTTCQSYMFPRTVQQGEAFSPEAFLRTRRPELFSDSVVEQSKRLDRPVLEYHLETPTKRGQETSSENFARKVAEQEKPTHSPNLLHTYERQICTYAHILERRYGKCPERLFFYRTAEPTKAEVLMQFADRPEIVDATHRDFDSVVKKIRSKDITIAKPPEQAIY